VVKSLSMFARLTTLTLASLSAVLLFHACEDETKNNSLTLVGRWELVRGFRNQKPTETLAGTYFQFGQDGKMKTNLPVTAEEPTGYEVNRNEIRQKSTPPIRYAIRSLSDSNLVLGLELRGMLFEMHFKRVFESKPGDILPDTTGKPDTVPPPAPDSSAQE